MAVVTDAADAELAKLKMPANATLLETRSLTAAEERELREQIVAKLSDPTLMDQFDETSRIRIYHGMVTNNKGTHEARIAEAIETYERIAQWRKANAASVLTKDLEGEALLFSAMNTHVGGVDLYGHLVWAERLGDIAAVVDHPLAPEKAADIRMKTTETIRILQEQRSAASGVRRYKQVYIVDLSEISLGSLIARGAVREMTGAILGAANSYCPETMWKCFIVNAPFIFRSVYTMISPFIHPVTKEKIKILGGPSKYIPELVHNGVPKAAIPRFLGGDHPDVTLAAAIQGLVNNTATACN